MRDEYVESSITNIIVDRKENAPIMSIRLHLSRFGDSGKGPMSLSSPGQGLSTCATRDMKLLDKGMRL